MARADLFRHLLLGAFLHGVHAIPLKRGAGDVAAFRAAWAVQPRATRTTSGRGWRSMRVTADLLEESVAREGWIIACGEGALQLIQVQLEGKKAMSAQDCLRGIHQSVSMVG